jgi:hypothetical protein
MRKEMEKMKEHNMLHEIRKILNINTCNVPRKCFKPGVRWCKMEQGTMSVS